MHLGPLQGFPECGRKQSRDKPNDKRLRKNVPPFDLLCLESKPRFWRHVHPGIHSRLRRMARPKGIPHGAVNSPPSGWLSVSSGARCCNQVISGRPRPSLPLRATACVQLGGLSRQPPRQMDAPVPRLARKQPASFCSITELRFTPCRTEAFPSQGYTPWAKQDFRCIFNP